jgi:hypothetical protein
MMMSTETAPASEWFYFMPAEQRYVIAAAALVCGVMFGCDHGYRAPVPPTWAPATTQPLSSTRSAVRGPEFLNVLEAVFRHQFEHNASGTQSDVDYYFLSLDDTDPPPELIARFKDHKPVVLPKSMAKASARQGVKHKDLGGHGLIFSIDTIAWLDENTAVIGGGYYEAGLSASCNAYRVERRDGKWIVTKDDLIIIS